MREPRTVLSPQGSLTAPPPVSRAVSNSAPPTQPAPSVSVPEGFGRYPKVSSPFPQTPAFVSFGMMNLFLSARDGHGVASREGLHPPGLRPAQERHRPPVVLPVFPDAAALVESSQHGAKSGPGSESVSAMREYDFSVMPSDVTQIRERTLYLEYVAAENQLHYSCFSLTGTFIARRPLNDPQDVTCAYTPPPGLSAPLTANSLQLLDKTTILSITCKRRHTGSYVDLPQQRIFSHQPKHGMPDTIATPPTSDPSTNHTL